MISPGNVRGGGGVHGGILMTGDTVHLQHRCVNIPLTPLPKKLIANATAMAGRALIDGIRTLLEQVTIEKSILGGFRPAHMTSPAPGMAIGAMTLIPRVDLIPFTHIRPCF